MCSRLLSSCLPVWMSVSFTFSLCPPFSLVTVAEKLPPILVMTTAFKGRSQNSFIYRNCVFLTARDSAPSHKTLFKLCRNTENQSQRIVPNKSQFWVSSDITAKSIMDKQWAWMHHREMVSKEQLFCLPQTACIILSLWECGKPIKSLLYSIYIDHYNVS